MSPQPVSARPATFADIPALIELMSEFYAESDHPLDLTLATRGFSRLIGDPSLGAAWLLLDGAEPAGFVTMTIRFAMEVYGLDAFVDDLFVRRAHRRRGIGSLGLRTALKEARQRGALALHVEVGIDNYAALALYASIGFEPREDDRVSLRVGLPPEG